MSGWSSTTLGKLCDQGGGEIRTGPFGSQLHQSDYSDEGIPVVMPKDIANGRVEEADIARVSPEHIERLAQHKLLVGDIVYGRRGDIGRKALVTEREAGWLCGTGCLRVTVGSSADPRFLFYRLGHPDTVAAIQNRAVGATMPNLNTTILREVELTVPPLETQRRIASILGAYDDLIEVNRRRVAILEEMARGLFEEWFVRFRFPGHEGVKIEETPDGRMPEGWRFASLDELAEVAFGYPFKSKAFSSTPEGARVVRIRDVPEGVTATWTTEPFHSRYNVVNGDILVGMDGIFHMAVWVGGDAALNQRVTRLRPRNGHSSGWLFRSVYPHIKFFEATISGTTVAHLGAKHLKMIRIPVATPEVQTKADAFCAPIDESLINLRVANQRLAASRDLLLPRLISGQLSVEAAERELEDAA